MLALANNASLLSLIQPLAKTKGFSKLLCGWQELPSIVIEMDFCCFFLQKIYLLSFAKKCIFFLVKNLFAFLRKSISLWLLCYSNDSAGWITSCPLGSSARSHHRKHWRNKYKTPVLNKYKTPVLNKYKTPDLNKYKTPVLKKYKTPVLNK